MKAWVVKDIAPLMSLPRRECELADEALFGMPLEVLGHERGDWYRVRTCYRYEGMMHRKNFLPEEMCSPLWLRAEKKVVLTPYADVLAEPKVQGAFLQGIPRGGRVGVLEELREERWRKVVLPSGAEGWTRTENLAELLLEGDLANEEELRESLVRTAEMYLGAQYRWGGKTHRGLDCSGLCSMAYLLNGIVIYRDAKIAEGFALREIEKDALKKGDLMFFPGHVAMYIEDGRFIHSSSGNNGVDYNSLRPEDEDFHPYLRDHFEAAASIFG